MSCKANPASCGIKVNTQADLDNARDEGKKLGKDLGKKACKVNPASCDIDINGAATVIGQDLSLHVPKAQYKTLSDTQLLWIDMKFLGQNKDEKFLWSLTKFGPIK